MRCIKRVAAFRRMRGAVVAATLVVLVALDGGCRREQDPVSSEPLVPQGLRFAQGETFRYTRTVIDPFGYLDPKSETTLFRRVVSTQAVVEGRSGVAVLTDSIASTVPTGPDTLLLQMGNDGSLYAFGFLSDVMFRKDRRVLAPSWDRLAAFGAEVHQFWTVGTSDSAGTATVYGVFTGETRYFTATVNGVSTLFQGRRAQLSGDEVTINLWISDQPSALAEIAEEARYPVSGMLYELTDVHGAP